VKAPMAVELDGVKHEVLGKLMGRNPIPLIGHVAERAKYILFTHLIGSEIHNVMSRALHGESNTLLLLGGPGSCKSAIVASALERLKREHPDTGSFYTI